MSRTNALMKLKHRGCPRSLRRNLQRPLSERMSIFCLIYILLIAPTRVFTFQTHQCRGKNNALVLHGSKSGGRLINTLTEYEIAIAGDDRPVIVWFTAPWCGPCRLSIPVIKDIIKQYSGKLLPYEICTDDLPDVTAGAGVVSIPTIHLYFRGEQYPGKLQSATTTC